MDNVYLVSFSAPTLPYKITSFSASQKLEYIGLQCPSPKAAWICGLDHGKSCNPMTSLGAGSLYLCIPSTTVLDSRYAVYRLTYKEGQVQDSWCCWTTSASHPAPSIQIPCSRWKAECQLVHEYWLRVLFKYCTPTSFVIIFFLWVVCPRLHLLPSYIICSSEWSIILLIVNHVIKSYTFVLLQFMHFLIVLY